MRTIFTHFNFSLIFQFIILFLIAFVNAFHSHKRFSQKSCVKTVAFLQKIVYNIKAARRRGVSGTLYLKSAIAELNAFLDVVYGRSARRKER